MQIKHRRRTQLRIGLALAAFLLHAFSAGAVAQQQQFTLTDEDTWKQTFQAEPGTPEGQLFEARQALAENEFERAARLASQWIDRHPRHSMLAEAHLVRADALVGQNDEYEALFDYEYIARMHPGSEVFVTALQRELGIAKDYADGKNRKLWGMRIVGAEDEAEELFIRIQERMPGSRIAEEAGMELADFYFERRQMELAATAYELFIENYPKSAQLDKARRRLIYSHLATFKGPEFDPRGLYEARARLHDLRMRRPTDAQRMGADALLTRIDESDAAKMLETARWYLRTGNPVAAELTIRRLVKKYPRSVATADAIRLMPEILPKLPPCVRETAPDYEALRMGMAGVDILESG